MDKISDPTKKSGRSAASGIEIREMVLDDLPSVFALGEQLFTAEKWPNLYRTWDEFELLSTFSTDKELCLVAEKNEKIVGFILGSLIEKPRSAWVYGYMEWIGVDPEVKSRGIGTKLLNKLTDLFIKHRARMMLVDTELENQDALLFFKKMGFGNETKHIFLSRNLTSHPDYLKRKAERDQLKMMKESNVKQDQQEIKKD
ncbi:MAG: GNAT family N-acetyltransferase [Candidatus Aminicenantes bacterium]|nr:GNAT family N-acetyltransferase [Candidatus Aminicenantes bacterium]MDH5384086.1 GNAT family N-acetyltransferase [Candidatus Aminicenantes bacterium]MDH5742086.1 GNAT family N-acetyltransferase [Candidatus Aminicenantes bacterium]